MQLCTDCIDGTLGVIKGWLEQGYAGGIILHDHSHWDAETRRECPAFLFHWDIDEFDPDLDEDDFPDE